jgi:hypothetical protein
VNVSKTLPSPSKRKNSIKIIKIKNIKYYGKEQTKRRENRANV